MLAVCQVVAADQWSVSYNGNILQAGYGTASSSPQFVALDLASSYLRMNYGPPSGWGTSIVTMPSYWSGGTYRQGYAVSESHQVVGANLVLSLHGVSTALSTDATITFFPPNNGVFQALVQATTTGTVQLDNRAGEAFKPLMLSSMHESAANWDASAPYVGSVQYSFPNGGWIISPSALVSGDRFGLLGGSSSWKPNAPAVDIKLAAPMQIAGWLNTDNNPNDDNVGYWSASTSVLPSWSYVVTVSNATAPPEAISGSVTLQNYGTAAGTTITIEIRQPGTTTPVDSQTVALDANGNFNLTTLVQPGVYDMAAKGSHWLRKTLSNVTLTHSGLSGLAFSLVNGDINGDNRINLSDFALLRTAFGSTPTSSNWNPSADLNGDGRVNLSDFAILRTNFSQIGDP